MAWTQAQHDSLERAIAEGARRVQYEDRTVEYRSQSEMLALLQAMKRALGLTSTSTGVIKVEFDRDR